MCQLLSYQFNFFLSVASIKPTIIPPKQDHSLFWTVLPAAWLSDLFDIVSFSRTWDDLDEDVYGSLTSTRSDNYSRYSGDCDPVIPGTLCIPGSLTLTRLDNYSRYSRYSDPVIPGTLGIPGVASLQPVRQLLEVVKVFLYLSATHQGNSVLVLHRSLF